MRTKDGIKQGIASMLQRLREKHGFSKNRMSEVIGVNKHTWYAWESGTTCPSVADFIAAYDACDEPVMRPLMEMLSPDDYEGVTDQSDITRQREALAHFVTHDASDHMIRVLNFLMSGDHGSEIAAQVEQLCALDHLALEYRYMIAEQIYLLFVMSEHRCELIATDSVMPNKDLWASALKEGQRAAYGRLRSYSTTNK